MDKETLKYKIRRVKIELCKCWFTKRECDLCRTLKNVFGEDII